MRRILPWVYLLVVILAAVASFIIPWDDWLRQGQGFLQDVKAWTDAHFALAIIYYALFYVAYTSLSVPGVLLLNVCGGWMFGWIAVGIACLASATGGTLACYLSRSLFQERVLAKHGKNWEQFQQEFARNGWIYLLAVRLNPLIPYFLENLFFGLTRMPLWQFWVVSLVGFVPLTSLYVWAGSELARVETLQGLVSPRLILVLVTVSLLPLLLRWATARLGRRNDNVLS
jgi:uncharacterized membrane protein YdjX (TVP38/TMEM64 family)